MDTLPSFDEASGQRTALAQRESRIGSIYEKYLYDPRDLLSQDPVIREFARKASTEDKVHPSPRLVYGNVKMSNGSPTARKQFQTGAFAEAMQPEHMENRTTASRQSAGLAYHAFGALMNDSLDIDHHSDDEDTARHREVTNQNLLQRNDSWGARAVAVGQRPPDTASQNPPSLKLLSLKSRREGGASMGSSGSRMHSSPRNPNKEISMSEYGAESSRFGSRIDFAVPESQPHRGVRSNGFAAEQRHDDFEGEISTPMIVPGGSTGLMSEPATPGRSDATSTTSPQSFYSRKALTTQLGLDTPLAQDWQSSDYFVRHAQGAAAGTRRSLPRQPADAYLSPQKTRNDVLRSPTASVISSSDSPHSPFHYTSTHGVHSLVSPIQSPSGSDRQGSGSSQGSQKPLLLCQKFDPVSPSPVRAMSPGLGFSEVDDAASHFGKQSIVRRSLLFVTGSSGPSRPLSSSSRQSSIIRRSIAFFVGKPTNPALIDDVFDGDDDAPAPRVRGFEQEKDSTSRESQYTAPRGDGEEWDADGAAASFWRRFDVARKHAELDAKEIEHTLTLRRKVERQRKLHMWASGVGGVLILAAVIAIIVWRESLNDSDDQPTAVDSGKYNGTTQARRDAKATPAGVLAVDLGSRAQVDDLWAKAQVNSAVNSPLPFPIKAARPVSYPEKVRSPAEIPPYGQKQSAAAHKQVVKRHCHLREEARLIQSE